MLKFFRWQDVTDIALVTYIIYKTLSLLVGTRAIQLVKGLFLLVVLSFVARWLNLDTFSWILTQGFSALLIIVPIIFQPELRRILEELGRGSMWRRSKALKRAEVVADEVSKALMYCCAHKIGALIVLQRGTGLKDYWRNAVLLNADITQELIIAIFWPNNPLHDGATIIDTEQIISAGCYLPLTENADLSRWLGTRHRAAIGVTEVSDAVSLIVSEERGEISLAIGGRISRNLKESQLKKYLVHYFSGQDQEQQGVLESLKEELRSFGSNN
ncbi:diadenylate cyclase CdaA [Pyramidobacter piscolens]|uniref:diadenylate cyclase CdaA n=1 Tax=Pyramidobacter piscolens TaxID=638849 RepID=UPI0033247CA9